MSLLKTEPPEGVRSLAELFAVAYALEEQAAVCYREMAARMRELGAPSTAAVFEHLAESESEHRDRIKSWSEQRSGKPPNILDIRWHIPQTFDEEDAGDVAGSRLVTPYRALAIAVRNEERAFAFWSYIAARAEEAPIRDAAEAMAREELEHVSLLRQERRRAYHSVGRGEERSARRQTSEEALTEAADLEWRLGAQLDRLRLRQLPEAQTRLSELAEQSRQMVGAESGLMRPTRISADEPDNLDGVLATAEYLIELYLDAAEHAQDAVTMNRAQLLAGQAIARLTSLRAIGANIDQSRDQPAPGATGSIPG
jgi:rubrerythrin